MTLPGHGGPRAVGQRDSGTARNIFRTNAFTLVELLVVMSIILTVAVVALPSIGSLSKASSRRTGVSVTMAALDQARALALAESAPHYLVFTNADPSLPQRYRGRAFAIFQEVYQPKSQTYQRLPVTPWTLLPEGIAFKPDIDTLYGTLSDKFYCRPANRELPLPYIKFNGTGGVEQPTTAKTARVRLFEGFLNEDGSVVATNPAKDNAEESIRVSIFTGRAKREEAGDGQG